MKPAAFLLVMMGMFFGSMDGPSIVKESKASKALNELQGQVQFIPTPTMDQRVIERLLLSIARRCEGQDPACFERKLGFDARYRASSKV